MSAEEPLSRIAKEAYQRLLAGDTAQVPDEIENELVNAGALTDQTEKSVIPPGVALSGLLSERLPETLHSLEGLIELAHAYDHLLRTPHGPPSPEHQPEHPQIEFLAESAQRQHANYMVLNAAQHDLFVIEGEDPPAFTPHRIDADTVRPRPPGLHWREVVTFNAIASPDRAALLRASAEELDYQVRAHRTVPVWLSVADDDLAILSTGPYPRCGALLVRVPAVVQLLRSWCEHLWSESVDVPFSADADGGVQFDATGFALLDLMTAGLTDDAIARAMDVSVRTIRRRIERMCDLADVSNRIQLALVAREHGWSPRLPRHNEIRQVATS